jgi:predicted RNA-binding protein with PIN domain
MEKPQKLIIDGYNVIYTDDSLRRAACRDLQGARDRLVDLLKQYLKRRHLQVTVVFDGRGGLVDAEPVVPCKLQVLFSADDETADELILATIRRSPSPQSFVVVTSDMADIGRTARGMGCEVIGSKRFLDRIAGNESPSKGGGREDTRRDFGDTEYWLEQFGEKRKDPDEPE